MPELLTPDEQAAADTYRQVNGGARQPATWGEIWDANWKRGGLDTVSGLGRIQRDEHDRLKTAIQTELGTTPIEDYARNRGLPIAAPSFDKQVKALNDIADTLSPEQQTKLNEFRDVRGRAAKAAAKIDDDASEVDRSTYGVSGWVVGGVAGMAAQAIDPFSVVTSVTGGIAGVGRGILRQSIGGAVGNILPTLGMEPAVAEQRERLGLETSFTRSLTNIAAAGVVGGAIGATPPAIAAGFRAAGIAPLSDRIAAFGTRLRRDPVLAAKTPFDADTVDTVAMAVRRDEVTGPAAGKNPIEHETMVGGAKEAANVRGSLHDDARVVPDTEKPVQQPVMSVDRSAPEPAKPAAPEPVEAAAAPAAPAEPAAPEVVLNRATYVKGTETADAALIAKDVGSQVRAALKRGDSVTYFVEDKPVEIVKVTKGMMQDAQGQRWGTLPLLSPTPGKRTEVVITPKAAAVAPTPEVKPPAAPEGKPPITVGDPVLEQQVRSTIAQRGDLTFVVDDAGTEMSLSKALDDAHNDATALSELRGCIEGNKG